MIASIFTQLDSWLALAAPEGLRVVIWGAVSGLLSIGLYALTSPQRRLAELKQQSSELNRKLASYDGNFSGAMALTRQNVILALRRLGCALGPSLLAAAPVVIVLIGMAGRFGNMEVLSWGPAWVRSWLTVFLIATTCAALGAKAAFRIE